MKVEIIDTPFHIEIYGFSGVAANKDYAATAFKLSGQMWQTIKEAGIKNKGQNIWVYEPDEIVFAGVELREAPANDSKLQFKNISLKKYAYFKHIGPFSLIKQVGQNMAEEIKRRGFQATLPYIEIYGHWHADETKLETELLMSLK
jgi:effector-binding domain-containing protein